MMPHIVLIKVPHVIVNGHEPKSPVVFLCDEIIKLVRQALVAEAVIAEDKALYVEPHLRYIKPFQNVAHGLERVPQFDNFGLPLCYQVIGGPLFQTVI